MEKERYFCNPVPFEDGQRHTNPDPYVMRWCGKYYCYATDEKCVKVSVSEDLTNWHWLGYAISEKERKDYWAPSVIYLNGRFYMYYSDLDINEADVHQHCLQLAVSDKPEGPFYWKKTFFKHFSIDSHPVFWNEKLYMFYSVNDWIGTDERIAGTVIVLDEMLSPEMFSGHPKAVVLPSIEQEIYEKNRFGDGRDWYTIEGAATVVHGNKCFLTYSANAYVNTDYFVGTAVAKIQDNFLKMVWEKYPSKDVWYPLLKKNNKVEGTGHNTIVKAPNMVDDWIVYHGRMAEEALIAGTEQREMRIDPLIYNGCQLICDGPTQSKQMMPGRASISLKDIKITGEEWLSDIKKYYYAEYWISAQKSHTGCHYDIYLAYKNAENYVKLKIHSGRNRAEIIECANNIETVLASCQLEEKYDYSVPHEISVERQKTDWLITFDERYQLKCTTYLYTDGEVPEKVGINAHFSDVTLHSFAMTDTMHLEGRALTLLGDQYVIGHKVCVDESGMHIGNEKVILEKHIKCFENYTEEIQFEGTHLTGYVNIGYGDKKWEIEASSGKSFSVYCVGKTDEISFWIDGKKIKSFPKVSDEHYYIEAYHVDILLYRYTKN